MGKRSEVSIEIAADAASVFRALTEPAALERWFAEHAEIDREGGRVDFWGKHTHSNPGIGEGDGRILSWIDGGEFSFEWTVRGVLGVMTLSLAPSASGTRVTAVHEYQPPTGNTAHLDGLWCLPLQNLRSWVETGRVLWRPDYSNIPTREIRLTVEAEASPARVFDALVDPAQLSRWMMAASPTVEPTIGGQYDLGWPEGEGRPLKILEIVPNSRLSYSWVDADSPGTVVTWELDGSAGGTRITLVHSGFDDSVPLDDYYGGWADFLLRLVGITELRAGWTPPKWSGGETLVEAVH